MKFCPNCRIFYDDDDDCFCGECGTKLVDSPLDVVDYYRMFNIDKTLGSEEIIKYLRQKQSELQRKADSPISETSQDKLNDIIDKLSDAIRTFKNRDSYDRELAEAYAKFNNTPETKKRKRKKNNNPDEFYDYYKLYDIDPNLSGEEIIKYIRKKQGEYTRKASSCTGNAESQDKLNEAILQCASAIRAFKDKNKYDKELAKAYKEGKIKEEIQQAAKDLLEELERMFDQMNFNGVIRKCNEALNSNIKDVRIYHYLASANYNADNVKESFEVITRSLTEYPNDFFSLKLGARLSTAQGAYDYAQGYINRMLEVYKENPVTTCEQCFLYEQMDKSEMAFKLIDDYLEKNPNDLEFRRACANDLIGLSYNCYTEDMSSGSMFINSKESYDRCLTVRNKAAEICNDNRINDLLKEIKYFGKTEYNSENTWHIIALVIGGLIYGLLGFNTLSSFGQNPMSAVLVTLGIGLTYSGYRLYQVSHRPYWQINKFIMTGRREKDEARYIKIGSIFVGYLKFSYKISTAFIRFALFLFRK